jgi:hypothetical protein
LASVQAGVAANAGSVGKSAASPRQTSLASRTGGVVERYLKHQLEQRVGHAASLIEVSSQAGQ